MSDELVAWVDAQKPTGGKSQHLVFVIDEMGTFIGDSNEKIGELNSLAEMIGNKGNISQSSNDDDNIGNNRDTNRGHPHGQCSRERRHHPLLQQLAPHAEGGAQPARPGSTV